MQRVSTAASGAGRHPCHLLTPRCPTYDVGQPWQPFLYSCCGWSWATGYPPRVRNETAARGESQGVQRKDLNVGHKTPFKSPLDQPCDSLGAFTFLFLHSWIHPPPCLLSVGRWEPRVWNESGVQRTGSQRNSLLMVSPAVTAIFPIKDYERK